LPGASLTNASGSITVPGGTATNSPPITFQLSGGVLTLAWPADHLGWIAQSNSVSLANAAAWFDIPNSQTATQLNMTPNLTLTNVYYRLRQP
jgi:hypothetical protein